MEKDGNPPSSPHASHKGRSLALSCLLERQAQNPVNKKQKQQQQKKTTPESAFIEVKHVGVPLVSNITGSPCQSIRLHADRLYTIGRSAISCDFLLCDPRVSNPHCHLFFLSDLCKLFIVRAPFHLSSSSTADKGEASPRSFNRVFVNGVNCARGFPVELSAGDEVLLVCAGDHRCGSPVRIGFFIHTFVLGEENMDCPGSDDSCAAKKRLFLPWTTTTTTSSSSSKRVSFSRSSATSPGANSVIHRAKSLLAQCRHMLRSADPISCIQRCPSYLRTTTPAPLACTNLPVSKLGLTSENLAFPGDTQELETTMPYNDLDANCKKESMHRSISLSLSDFHQTEKVICLETGKKVATHAIDGDNSPQKDNEHLENVDVNENAPHKSRVYVEDVPFFRRGNICPPPGKYFCLNRLESIGQASFGCHSDVSLVELLHPVESITRIFIATFTCDISWFLSYCQIPYYLSVTVACHDTDRCWSTSPQNRTFVPNPEYPNVVVVYPQFPEIIAFGRDRHNQGIACHHPKLLVLQREDQIRVIITSANLVAKQWTGITNTVWWQDFPQTSAPDYSSLFNRLSDEEVKQGVQSDFAAQLAGFMACLLIDAPSQAHWIVELTKYNFHGAMGYLIASVPGIHSYRPQRMDLIDFLSDNQVTSSSVNLKHLAVFKASVVGLNHLFHTRSDSNGVTLRRLASFLANSHSNACGMVETVLRREKSIAADFHAVSVLVSNPDDSSKRDSVQVGFLPKDFAKWLSPLWDAGFFRFSGYVSPKEVTAAAIGGNNKQVTLMLHVFQGPSFADMPKMQHEHVNALCHLVASIERCTGLCRLNEVLEQYRWPDSLETDFVYGSSSIGSSVNAQFLAAFSAAAGKKSSLRFDSEESDPEWGCWTASQELKNPSIRIVFPTIERVKNAVNGISTSKQILCFSERTWQTLKSADILYDAIPYPSYRIGLPMHTKVAMRRFRSPAGAPSFGWIYCGSHNFSAAAWGRMIHNRFDAEDNTTGCRSNVQSTKLHICNYELGILFIVPPTETDSSNKGSQMDLDKFVLPFVMPAPKYGPCDRPATAKAMKEAMVKISDLKREFSEVASTVEMMEHVLGKDELVEAANGVVTIEEEITYANSLWSHVHAS